jgi:nucleotide-binding universal stress UspA family protein
MSRVRRILHPTDFSKASASAFKRATEMAKANRAELLLIHVLTPSLPLMTDGYVSPQVYEQVDAAARGYAQKHLGALVSKAKRAGLRVKSLLVEPLMSGLPRRRGRRGPT